MIEVLKLSFLIIILKIYMYLVDWNTCSRSLAPKRRRRRRKGLVSAVQDLYLWDQTPSPHVSWVESGHETDLGGHWHHHMIKWTRPSPCVFAYYKWSKTRRWEGLGTRLWPHYHCILLWIAIAFMYLILTLHTHTHTHLLLMSDINCCWQNTQ